MSQTPTAIEAAIPSGWLQAILDHLPVALMLIEPGTARVLFANREAHELAGGSLALASTAAEYADLYPCTDLGGRPLSAEEMPGPRAAAGERPEVTELVWLTPAGPRALVVWVETVPELFGQPSTLVVGFQDASALQDSDQRLAERVGEIGRLLGREQLAREAAETAESRLRRQLEINLAITNSLGEGLFAVDAKGRLTSMNPAAERMLGWSESEVQGQSAHDLFHYRRPSGERYPAEECPAVSVLRTGRTEARDQECFFRRDGSMFPVAYTSAPIVGEAGVVGAVHAFADITERKHAEAQHARLLEAEHRARVRAEFLATATEALERSLDYEQSLQAVARTVVSEFAECAVFNLYRPDGIGERVALAHRDPEHERLLLERTYRSPQARDEAADGRLPARGPWLIEDLDDDARRLLAQTYGEVEILDRIGVRSLLTTPLIARGRVMGSMALGSGLAHRFDAEDLRVAEDLARRCALAVDNGRLYRERSTIARVLQESLLPPQLPEIPGMDMAARYLPAGQGTDVGGDFYDVFEVGSTGWAVVIGDVCGKGAEAAAITAQARYTIRAAAMRERRPSAVLAFLNSALLAQRTDGRFCTVVHTLLERDGARVRLRTAVAGHPPPLLLRADGTVEQAGELGTLLGVVAEPRLVDHVTNLSQDDAVVLFTDGVTEARTPDGGELGRDRLIEVLAQCAGSSADQIVDRIVAEVGPERRDDVAIVVLRMTGHTRWQRSLRRPSLRRARPT